MTIWLINDRPEHTVLIEAITLLRRAHDVVQVNPCDPAAISSAVETLMTVKTPAPAGTPVGRERREPDVVLLKSHHPAAIGLGRHALAAGAVVVNQPEATAACLDRTQMAYIAKEVGVPFPDTSAPAPLRSFAGQSLVPGPMVVKSRQSRRGDLVTRVDDASELAALACEWPDEEVIVQPMLSGDGWDHKIWVIGAQVFYGRRRSPLDGALAARDGGHTVALTAADLPPGWQRLVRDVGSAYRLSVFGLDLLATATGPVVIDVNPFPGCRGVAGAARAIRVLVDRLTEPVR